MPEINIILYVNYSSIKKKNMKSSIQKKKDLHYPDNHDGVITHLEPDILECEVT